MSDRRHRLLDKPSAPPRRRRIAAPMHALCGSYRLNRGVRPLPPLPYPENPS
jgi:hypothetical protein